MAQNTNESMRNANGEIIKILYMDDYFANENSLQIINNNFRGSWMVTGCEHFDGDKQYGVHYPKYNKKILFGFNTIGSPSVLSLKNEGIIFFDENMTWVLDCDYYVRLYKKYGKPTVLNEINVIIGTGKHQMTQILPNFKKIKEHFRVAFKHWRGLL